MILETIGTDAMILHALPLLGELAAEGACFRLEHQRHPRYALLLIVAYLPEEGEG